MSRKILEEEKKVNASPFLKEGERNIGQLKTQCQGSY